MFRTARQLDTISRKKYQKQISEIFSKSNTSKKVEKAWHITRKISAMLKNKYKAEKVIAFGSITTKSFNDYSDIDIGVTGIPSDKFYKAVAETETLSNEFNIDLLDIEDCSPALKEKILHDGVNL